MSDPPRVREAPLVPAYGRDYARWIDRPRCARPRSAPPYGLDDCGGSTHLPLANTRGAGAAPFSHCHAPCTGHVEGQVRGAPRLVWRGFRREVSVDPARDDGKRSPTWTSKRSPTSIGKRSATSISGDSGDPFA